MKHLLGMICAIALAILLGGCAQSPRRIPRGTALLFDAVPGSYNAAQWAQRAPWLTAPAHFSDGETVYYRERFYDRQGNGFGTRDYFTRRFIYVREGRGHR